MEDNFLDDYFYLKKNAGPPSDKNVVRNRLLDSNLRYMNVYHSIFKTYHVPEGSWSEEYHEKMDKNVLNRDFEPFVFYSGNKHWRWELEVDGDLLENLEEFNGNLPVVALERSVLDSPFVLLVFDGHQWYSYTKITTLHCLKNDQYYSKSAARGVGSNYSDFKQDPCETTQVVYHFLSCPKNYKQCLHKKYFGHGSGWKYPRIGYWKRLERNRDILEDVKYEDWDYLDEEAENDPDPDFETKSGMKCYNLEDHFIEKFHFVKRRK